MTATPIPSSAQVISANALAPADPWIVSPAALALWLLIQLGCLALALLHVPLAASYPPGERLAVDVLLAGQFGSAALLAPMLCRSLATALLAAASAWPALILAGAFQVRPLPATLLAAVAVTFWIAMLWAWCTAFASQAHRAIVSAVATLLAVGAPLLVYLRVEFAPGSEGDASSAEAQLGATPILLAWRLAAGDTMQWNEGPLWLGVLLLGLTIRFRRILVQRTRRLISKSNVVQ